MMIINLERIKTMINGLVTAVAFALSLNVAHTNENHATPVEQDATQTAGFPHVRFKPTELAGFPHVRFKPTELAGFPHVRFKPTELAGFPHVRFINSEIA